METFTQYEKQLIYDAKNEIKTIVQATFVDLLKPLSFNGYIVEEIDNFFVSGGCIASLLQKEPVNDWDIYCSDKDILEYITKLLKANTQVVASVDEKYRELVGENGKLISENAITLKNRTQFITLTCGDPDDVRRTFDFVHCMPYYSIASDQLFISRQQFNACVYKKLIVNNQATVTERRTGKFLQRGYTL